ncbi:MAG: hypothetical protein ACTSXA_11660 [Candidatus Heimdallarchaeota archaeon]
MNLDLFPAVAWGAIFELANRPDLGWAMIPVDIVDHSLPNQMQNLYADGSYFELYVEASYTVIGNYHLTDQLAIVTTTFSKKRVFLISPHAEIEEDSIRDGLTTISSVDNDGSDCSLIYNAIEWLSFKNTQNNLAVSFDLTIVIIALVLVFLKESHIKH